MKALTANAVDAGTLAAGAAVHAGRGVMVRVRRGVVLVVSGERVADLEAPAGRVREEIFEQAPAGRAVVIAGVLGDRGGGRAGLRKIVRRSSCRI